MTTIVTTVQPGRLAGNTALTLTPPLVESQFGYQGLTQVQTWIFDIKAPTRLMADSVNLGFVENKMRLSRAP